MVGGGGSTRYLVRGNKKIPGPTFNNEDYLQQMIKAITWILITASGSSEGNGYIITVVARIILVHSRSSFWCFLFVSPKFYCSSLDWLLFCSTSETLSVIAYVLIKMSLSVIFYGKHFISYTQMSCTCSLWPMQFLFFSPLFPFGRMRQFLLDSLAEIFSPLPRSVDTTKITV